MHVYIPFAYVFNKFEILSGITICSEQYILDKTIFTIFHFNMNGFLLANNDLRAFKNPQHLLSLFKTDGKTICGFRKVFTDVFQYSPFIFLWSTKFQFERYLLYDFL